MNISALEDSQEITGSQDLFPDGSGSPLPPRNINSVNNRQILDMLKKMDGRLEALTNEVKGIKQMLTSTNTGKPSFQMESSSFKKKLNIFLKNQFTRVPWLDVKTDVEFKNEVNRNLRNDGYTNDAMALKSVITWSSGRYTDYRNQLRRKIITELKKKDLAVVPIEEFAESVIGGFCSSGVDVNSPDRIKLCLLLRLLMCKPGRLTHKLNKSPKDFYVKFRSFLHKNKMLTQDSLKLEVTADFWHSFREFYDEFIGIVKADKWETLSSLDRRRTTQKDKEN